MIEPHNRVHLIGSVPLRDSATVFGTLSSQLGPYVSRLPDGETGQRSRWIFFQHQMLQAHPAMEPDPTAETLKLRQWDGTIVREILPLRIKPTVDPATVSFPTGYDAAALESWETFQWMRESGAIPGHVKFQVCLPTPMSSGCMYVSPAGRALYMQVYERSLLKALHGILAVVPHRDLSIQFDVCQEVLVFEDYFPGRTADYKAEVFGMLGRLGDAVPGDVELGYHLCYGSPADEHLVQARDAGVLVEMMNGISGAVGRRIDFLHIPVPKDRDDDAYFAPLAGWRGGAWLYMGLIHFDDAAGDRRRIAAARRVVREFGVASECGWGRTDPMRVPGLVRAHRLAAEGL